MNIQTPFGRDGGGLGLAVKAALFNVQHYAAGVCVIKICAITASPRRRRRRRLELRGSRVGRRRRRRSRKRRESDSFVFSFEPFGTTTQRITFRPPIHSLSLSLSLSLSAQMVSSINAVTQQLANHSTAVVWAKGDDDPIKKKEKGDDGDDDATAVNSWWMRE